MHEKKLLAIVLLLGGLLVMSTSLSVGPMPVSGDDSPVDAPSVPQQAIDPYLEIISPSTGEVYYAADQYTHPLIRLEYAWEGTSSGTFSEQYGWDLYTDYDLAVFIDERYLGAPAIDEPKDMPVAPGSHNLTIIVGAFGPGYTNTTVTQSVYFDVEQTSTVTHPDETTYTLTITVTSTVTVQSTVTATLTVTGTETQTEYVTETITETTTVDGNGNPIALFKREQVSSSESSESEVVPGFLAIAAVVTLIATIFVRRRSTKAGLEV